MSDRETVHVIGEDGEEDDDEDAAGDRQEEEEVSEHSEDEGRGPVPAIQAEELRKRYASVDAVDGLTFAVAAGETFGLLGPNGAGKSTTISMLCTLVRPTAGTARIAGFDVVNQQAEVRRRIGLVFQDTTLDVQLTAEENLVFHAALYGVPKAVVADRLRQVLDLVGLWDRRRGLVRTFSGGMKRRLEIARGLLHSPRVLFLDEPTVGLDPQTRNRIWEYVEELKAREAVTLFLTTHYMDEAEHCDRIGIVDGGRLVVVDSPEALKAGVGHDVVRLRTADDRATVIRLRELMDIESTEDATGVTIRAPGGEELVPRLLARLDVPVLAVTVERPTLDDVFMAHTGRSIREAEQGDGRIRQWMKGRRSP